MHEISLQWGLGGIKAWKLKHSMLIINTNMISDFLLELCLLEMASNTFGYRKEVSSIIPQM
jgi:hypothetical protein